MACVIFSSVFLESTVGLDYYGGLDAEEAGHFHEVAWDTVWDDFDLWNISQQISAAPDPETLLAFHLKQNFPNPFNPQTTIFWQQEHAGLVSLGIFDLRGQLVKALINDHRPAGDHSVLWDGTDQAGSAVSSGIYFYQLNHGNAGEVKSMVLVR